VAGGVFEEETGQPQVSDLDLMFFDGRIDGHVQHLKLLDDPYLLVARPGAFPGGPVPLARLDGAPMVAHPPICDQARIEQQLARGGVRPEIVFRTVGNEAVLSMVRAGMGTALLPGLAILGHDTRADTTLSIHQLQPPLSPREIFLLWEKGTHPLSARRQGHRDRRQRSRHDRRGRTTARRTKQVTGRCEPHPDHADQRADHPARMRAGQQQQVAGVRAGLRRGGTRRRYRSGGRRGGRVSLIPAY